MAGTSHPSRTVLIAPTIGSVEPQRATPSSSCSLAIAHMRISLASGQFCPEASREMSVSAQPGRDSPHAGSTSVVELPPPTMDDCPDGVFGLTLTLVL